MSITTIKLENQSASVQMNVPQTFGQVFSRGHLPAGSAIKLVAPDNSELPCQIDVKATHADGSIKHAMISCAIPVLPASASIIYGIDISDSAMVGTQPVPADFPGLNAVATIVDTGTDVAGPNAGTTYTADVAARLAAGNYQTWRSGPLMSEWIVRVPLVTAGGVEHPDLHARFEIMAYKGQAKARIHCIIENSWVKAKVGPLAANSSQFEDVSNVPHVYRYTLTIGNQVVDSHNLSGYQRVRVTSAGNGTFGGKPTQLANDATVYTAACTVNGVVKNISVIGSQNQNFGQLFASLNTQLGGLATCVLDDGNLNLRLVAAGTGSASAISNFDYGTLFTGMTYPGLASTTVYTATVTIGGVAKAISVTGSSAPTFALLCAAINPQLGGLATCVPHVNSPGVRFISAATGDSSDIVITEGTLFAVTKTKIFQPFRPINGDEHIHYPYQRWTKTFWWGAKPQVHIRHDKAYLIAARAWPNYAQELTGSAASIAATLAEMKGNEGIGKNGVTKAFMGATGGAPGIGILPAWTAMYIVNQGADAKYIMLKQADLMGSWSVHVRDYDTDKPIDLGRWPYATFSPNSADSKNPVTGLREKLPGVVIPSAIPVQATASDVAHHPDFSFVPYMVTGDHCYMEGMLFYLAFCCLAQNPHGTWRDGGKCLFFRDQVRGQGWALRTLSHVRYLLPDSHPARASIEYIAAENVAWYNSRYVDDGAPLKSFFGHFGQLIYKNPVNGVTGASSAPFQEDHVISSLGRAVELGFTEYIPLLKYKSAYIKGRLTSGSAFCWQAATTYCLQYKEDGNSPEFTSWAQVWTKVWPSFQAATCGSVEMGVAIGEGQNAMAGYANSPEGFPANLQPAVAYCATYKMPSCEDAWLVFDSRTKKPDYNISPQFAIVPREFVEEAPIEPPPAETLKLDIYSGVVGQTMLFGQV